MTWVGGWVEENRQQQRKKQILPLRQAQGQDDNVEV